MIRGNIVDSNFLKFFSMKSLNAKKGFTLIELLIVIAIIAVLAVAFLPSLLGAPQKARDTQRVAQVNKITGFLLNKSLTGVSLPGGVSTITCIDSTGAAGTIGNLISTNVSDFGGTFPVDPKTANVTTGSNPSCTGQYGYVKYAAGLKFTAAVFAAVESIDNANIGCKNVKASAVPALTPGAVPAADGPAYCLLVNVQ